MKRSIPNLVSHIFGLGVAPLFSYFSKTGIFCQNRNVSVHFTRNFNVLTTIFFIAFNPQLKSLSSTQTFFLAAQLNNFEGRF
jgi:hypothetical protein